MDPPEAEENIRSFVLHRRTQMHTTIYRHLVNSSDIDHLPPLAFSQSSHETLCKEKHDHNASQEDCYLSILQDNVSNYDMAPTNPLFSEKNLVAETPIIDHICQILESTEESGTGASWKPFSEIPDAHLRQVSLGMHQRKVTIKLGASEDEILRFQNTMKSYFQEKGLTKHCIALVVGLVTPDHGKKLVIQTSISTSTEAPLPGIIAFSYFGRRFEIVIPWKRCNKSEGSHILQLNDGGGNAWAKMLNSLPFTPFVTVAKDITAIETLFSLCAPLHGQIKLQIHNYVTLSLVLSLVGWDLPTSDPTTVLYLCYGGLFPRPVAAINGFGKWGCWPLTKAQDHFIIAELFGLNQIWKCLGTSLLLHFFPSPLVNYTSSLMDPQQFKKWVGRLLNSILTTTRFKDEIVPVHLHEATPSFTRDNLKQCGHPKISIPDIMKLTPPWSHVTSGGPSSIGQILEHSVETLLPIFTKKGIGKDLAWKINPNQVQSISRLGLDSLPPTDPPSPCDQTGILKHRTPQELMLPEFDGDKIQHITNIFPHDQSLMGARSTSGGVVAAAFFHPNECYKLITRDGKGEKTVPAKYKANFSAITALHFGLEPQDLLPTDLKTKQKERDKKEKREEKKRMLDEIYKKVKRQRKRMKTEEKDD